MKISEEMAARILGAVRAQMPFKIIAKVSGVSYWSVRKIARGDRKVTLPVDDSLMRHLQAWFKGEQSGA